MAIPQRVSLVTLGVSDVARATAFYESLGWRRASASVESTTFFNTAGPILTLWSTSELAADAGVEAPGQGFRGVSLSINVESPDAVDAGFAEWVAAGGTPLKGPDATPWGGYIAYVADPDGHVWELAHNPGFELDEAGFVRAP
jgi:catechol 2,3-dioxygenase-like lactoylglutathione lyase family enzyme